jgi:hypothetical protein
MSWTHTLQPYNGLDGELAGLQDQGTEGMASLPSLSATYW